MVRARASALVLETSARASRSNREHFAFRPPLLNCFSHSIGARGAEKNSKTPSTPHHLFKKKKTAPAPLRGRRRRGPRRGPRHGPSALRRPALPLLGLLGRQRRAGAGPGRQGEEGGQPGDPLCRARDLLQRRARGGGPAGQGARRDAGLAACGDVRARGSLAGELLRVFWRVRWWFPFPPSFPPSPSSSSSSSSKTSLSFSLSLSLSPPPLKPKHRHQKTTKQRRRHRGRAAPLVRLGLVHQRGVRLLLGRPRRRGPRGPLRGAARRAPRAVAPLPRSHEGGRRPPERGAEEGVRGAGARQDDGAGLRRAALELQLVLSRCRRRSGHVEARPHHPAPR